MAANVRLFCEVAEQEGDKVFSSALALVWEFVSGDNNKIDFERQREKLEVVTPDPEQFDLYGVWPALDGFVALSALLSACEAFDNEEINAVLEVSRGTIDGFIEATGQTTEGELLLEQETAYIQSLLSVIHEQSQRRDCVAALKQRVRELSVSNIGISLE